MANGSFRTNSYNAGGLTCGLEFAWESTGQNIANNTTTIYWRLTGVLNDGYKYMMGGPFNITIQGNDRSSSTRVQVRNGQNVADGTITIPHNADGTCTLSVSVSAAIYTTSTSVSGNGSWALDTIPRASSITSAGNITLGNACSVKWTPAAAGFRYKVKFALGNWSYTTGYISPNTTSAYTYTAYKPPVSVATQIPNTTTGTMTATLYTYNSTGGSAIGSASKTFTVTVPTSVVPTVAAPTVTEATSGLESKFGAFVQNKSTLKIVSSPAGAQGSTITECKVTVDGKTYSGTMVTTSAIASSGTVKITVTVKDSRGRTATVTKDIAVVAYANPSIVAFSAIRCNASGVLDTGGTNLKVTMNFAISAVGNKNDKSYVVKAREQGGSTWTTLASGTVYSYNSSFVTSTFVAEAAKSYIVRLELSDYFTSSYVAETDVSSSFRLMNFGKDGVAIGKFSEGANFDVGIPAIFRESVTLGDSVTDIHQINGALVMNTGNIYIANGRGYFSRSNADSGTKDMYLIGCNSSNHTVVGYGGYSNGIGETHITGKVVKLISKDTGGVYINGYRPICGKYANGYAGLLVSTTDDSTWIRTTRNGLIPYQSGGASSLGVSSWPFSNMYTLNIYINSGTTALGRIYANSGDGNRLTFWTASGNGVTFRPDNGSGNGNISVVGSVVYTNSCFQYSSKRYKENIADIAEEDADKLICLNPVTFNYINTGTPSVGLIAEDTEPYFKELIMYDDENRVNGLNYIGLIPYIIKKMQMQQKELDALKSLAS